MHTESIMRNTQILKSAFLILGLAALASCSSGSGGDAQAGRISVSLMDRPVDDIAALFVTITGVSIKPKGDGPAFELPMTETPMTVDLLSLTDENAAVLVDNAVVDARDYNWIEFAIDDSDISKSYAMTNSGGQEKVDIDVPSDKIRLVSGFTVDANQAVQFLFDWEVGKGLSNAVGRDTYILKPAFRVLRVDELGAVSGRLTSATATSDATCLAVADPMVGKAAYFFDGAITPDDIDGTDPEPVTTADATFDVETGDYVFRAVLMPGDYTVAFTCLSDTDTEDGNEDLMFLAPLAESDLVTVSAAEAVDNVDF
jgi:hypothetical protein